MISAFHDICLGEVDALLQLWRRALEDSAFSRETPKEALKAPHTWKSATSVIIFMVNCCEGELM